MKKIISMLAIFSILMLTLWTGNSFAAALDTIQVETDKTTVRPGEKVVVSITFGKDLSSYTFDVSYDKNIFEYIEADGGTANDLDTKVRVNFHDTTGGTAPRTGMSVTFQAKADLITSNPTEFGITAEGLGAVESGTVTTLDDITTPIVKNVTVEPEYVDYTIKLEAEGEIVKGKEKAMTLSYGSTMGKPYEHARLVASATTPAGATVKLLATDTQDLEHDIIQSGWGDAQGYKIGGKDVSQVLQTRATFSDAGEYTITLKLIDRDNGDQVIAEQAIPFQVLEKETEITPPVQEPETPQTPAPEESETETQPEEKPSKLPKTGANIYGPAIGVVAILFISYLAVTKKK